MTSMSFRSLMPAQVDLIFGGGPSELGILMSMIGVGALLGSLFIAGLTENVPRGAILLAATGLSAMAILVSTFVSIFIVAMVAMMVLGLGRRRATFIERSPVDGTGRRGASRTCDGHLHAEFRVDADRSDSLGDSGCRLRTSAWRSQLPDVSLAASVILTWILTPRIRSL